MKLPSSGVDFVLYCRALALGGSMSAARAFAASRVGENSRVVRNLTEEMRGRVKAVIAAGDVGTWGAPLGAYTDMVADFAAAVRPRSAFRRFAANSRQLPMGVRAHVSTVILGARAGIAGHGRSKPVTKLDIAGNGLQPRVAAVITALTKELWMVDGIEAFLTLELGGAAGEAIDREFVEVAVGDTGVPEISASDTTAEAFLVDLANAASLMPIGQQSRLFLIVDQETLVRLALLPAENSVAFPDVSAITGGMVGGIEIIPSAAISRGPSGADLLLLSSNLFATAEGIVEVATSEAAALQLDDAPSTPPTAGTNVTALFQSNMIAVRLEQYFAAEKLHPAAAVKITGANYGVTGE